MPEESPLTRSLVLPALAALALLVSACPPIDGALDLSGIPDGLYDTPYTGQLQVLEYDGAVRFDPVSGVLPEGLTMDIAGAISGTPTEIGTYEVTVLATGMKRVEDFQGTVSLTIAAPEGAFLGYEHSQLNNMVNLAQAVPGGLMREIWVRASEAGEQTQQVFVINPGVYLPGVNLLAEKGQTDEGIAGRYDDVRIGDVAFSDLELEFFGWKATRQEWYDPNSGYPNPHIPEGDPPSVNSAGEVTAGVDTGGAELKMTHPLYGEVTAEVMVVPPDWCPEGTDYWCADE